MFELHDQPEEVNTMKHHEVNIVERTHSFDDSLIETESENATESSSSYGDTACGGENDAVLSDPEVMSQLHSDAFGDLGRIRKKRLTPHWKTYIQSHARRCKWVELQIRKFLSQASKYDMQLAHNSKRKQLIPNSFTIEDLGVQLLPLPSNAQRDKVMKRKKRKRVEDTIDKAAYIAQLNLFSYFGDRRSSAAVRSFGDDRANIGISMDKKVSTNSGFGLTDEPTSFEFSDDDNSMEPILLKIWILESRVREMQTRVKEVMSENAEQISSPRKLSVPVPCNTFIGSAQNLVSPPNNGDRMLVQSSSNASQLLPKYNIGDLVMPASAVSSHEKGAHLPDDIERTVQFQFGTSYKNSDGHLMNKHKAKEKPNISEEVGILNIEKFKVPKEEQEGTIPSSPDLEGLLTDDQPNPKTLPASKVASNTTRKRGRRKAGLDIWNRKS